MAVLCRRLYTVSLAYKESANCRLEANYAMQQEVDMIPLKMEEGYQARGWLVSPSSAKTPPLQL